MAELRAGLPGNSPIAQALGEDFHNLHAAVRKHYAEPTVHVSGTMDEVHVKKTIKPVALLSYMLFHAPVPHGGKDVEFSLHNRVDDSGAMHWLRTFFSNASFPEDVTFASDMVFSGDHRIIETTKYGVGIESDLGAVIAPGSGRLESPIRICQPSDPTQDSSPAAQNDMVVLRRRRSLSTTEAAAHRATSTPRPRSRAASSTSRAATASCTATPTDL